MEAVQFEIPRALWHTRVQGVVFFWMACSLLLLPFVGSGEHVGWLLAHALLLGAVTNALFIWTWHFTCAILRVPGQQDRSTEIQRLAVLNLGVVGVLIGVPSDGHIVTVVSAACIVAAVLHLGWSIRNAMRDALPSPYAFTARAYLAATMLLVTGAAVAVIHESFTFSEEQEPRVVLVHVTFNLLGWIGIPILGTIVTLWPTMLRTKIDAQAAMFARFTLRYLMIAPVVVALGLWNDMPALAIFGIAVYAAAFVVTLLPIVRVMRTKPATSFATRSALAGLAWMFLSLLLFAFAIARWGIVDTEEHGAGILVAMVAGGILQVLLGCMAYLLPAMAAGGPAKARWRNDRADRGQRLRLVITNAGVLLAIAAPDGGRGPGVALLMAGFAMTALATASTLRQPTEAEIAAAEAKRPPMV